MRRLFSVVVAAAAAVALSAAPAAADQALKLGPGPPTLTGDFDGRGAFVFHCNPRLGEGSGVDVFTPTGAVRGTCAAE